MINQKITNCAADEIRKKLNTFRSAKLLEFAENAPLSECCTFKIGGPADYIIRPYSVDGLREAIKALKTCGIEYYVFGNGSNLVFPDSGLRAAVIFTTSMKNLRAEGTKLYTEAGVSLSAAASLAQKNALSGLEFAYGIPGSCGGAVYMNAGAFNGEIKDVLETSTYYDLDADEFVTIENAAHDFDYRKSIYMKNNYIIVSAVFSLKEGDADDIKESMDFFWQRRVEKQPLNYPSAGSVFKRYQGFFTAKLIQDAGLKGYSVGGAQVSEKHSGFIINKGGATADDVKRLVDVIRQTIYDLHQINIECEIKFIE